MSKILARTARFGARHVLLAGIGAASLLRKRAAASASGAAGIAGRLPEASSILLEGIGERAMAFRAAAIARLALVDVRIRRKLETRVNGLPASLLPVLRTLGVARLAPVPRTRGASTKPVAKRADRKPRKAA